MDVGFRIESKELEEALKGIPRTVATSGVKTAATKAMKPVVSQVKMKIASELSGHVDTKGIRDYKRAIKVKSKKYKNSIWVGIGADVKTTAISENHDGKFTQWAHIGHLFEGGTKHLPGFEPIKKVMNENDQLITNRFKGEILTSILKAANRYKKARAIKNGTA